jgi:hypothetical protein
VKRTFVLIITAFIMLTGCKTIIIGDRETTGKIMFRNFINDSEKINEIYISGLFRVSGKKELPPVYLTFEAQGKLKDKDISFKMLSFKTPIFDIYFKKDKAIFVNHTNKEYVELNLEELDLSKFIGINFNPIDFGYFFLGKIPYSESMEMMNFKWSRKEYVMNITDNLSKYEIHIDADQKITGVKLESQYFDTILLRSIRYQKNDEGVVLPNMMTFLSEDGKIEISFILNKVLLKMKSENELGETIIKKYKKLASPDDIKVIIKNREKTVQ